MVFHGHALCQAMKLEGLSDRAEANLENRIRHLYVHSGPQYVLDVLKTLRSHTESQILNPEHRYRHQDGAPSISWDHSTDTPKHGLKEFYTRFPNPLDRIRVIRAAENTIVFEDPSRKQLEKVVNGLRSARKATDDYPIRFPAEFLRKMEHHLVREVGRMKPFDATHLTGAVLPYGSLSVSISEAKNDLAWYNYVVGTSLEYQSSVDRAHNAARLLDSETKGQFYTAPKVSKDRWNQIVDLSYRAMRKTVPDGVKYPSKVSPRPIEVRDYEIKSHNGVRLSSKSVNYDKRGEADLSGRFDFIQQPGGKLRSVANINRYVNYTMEPYAKTLEKAFYGRNEIDVTDQTNALRWVQKKFRSNRLPGVSLGIVEPTEIESIDLSSATDLLDFKVLTKALKADFPGKIGVLETYATYFEEVAALPLYCEPLGAPVEFKTGQPLGLKGSFQTLTVMNYLAGKKAQRLSDLPGDDMFRVVGDDFIADSRISTKYHEIIKSWAGETNEEKAMRSTTHGEFLSKLVTADNVYTLKPKYRLGKHAIFINAEKSKKRDVKGLYRTTEDEDNYLDILSDYSVRSLDDRTLLPKMRSLNMTVSSEEKEWMNNALEVLANTRGSVLSQTVEVPSVAIQLLYEEDDREIYRTHAPVISDDKGSRIASGPVHLDKATFSVGSERYNHRSGKHEQKQTLRQEYDSVVSRAKDMVKISEAIRDGHSPTTIDIGHGMTINTDDLVYEAIPDRILDDIEHSSHKPSRRQDFRTTEVQDEGPEL